MDINTLAEKIEGILEDHKYQLTHAEGRRWVAETTAVAVKGLYDRQA